MVVDSQSRDDHARRFGRVGLPRDFRHGVAVRLSAERAGLITLCQLVPQIVQHAAGRVGEPRGAVPEIRAVVRRRRVGGDVAGLAGDAGLRGQRLQRGRDDGFHPGRRVA